MKGFTHFMSGIAAATFIPEVARMSATSRLDTVEGASNSLILMLAGAFGVLPDTMDFKLGQFFALADFECDPDPRNPDPQAMADTFAAAVKQAGETGKEVRIQFFTTQLGASLWRQYNIMFEEWEVKIQFNEIVKTSQVPIPGTAPANRIGRARLAYPLKSRTSARDWLNDIIRSLRHKLKGPDHPPGPVKPSTIDIFGGTQFGLQREEDGRIYFNWLPWHRTWSHSYVLGALLTIPVFLIAFLNDLANWWLYGIVAFLGFAVHITEDMTGHIGGALLWPIHKPRCEGFELFKASDPRTNFTINWTCIWLILWNVDRFTTQVIPMPWFVYFPLLWLAPLVFYHWLIPQMKKRLQLEDAKHRAQEREAFEEADGMGEMVVD